MFVSILLGSTDSFLFSLRPKLDIYRPTGLNTNYFYLNTGQETFPNGVVSNYLYTHEHLNATINIRHTVHILTQLKELA